MQLNASCVKISFFQEYKKETAQRFQVTLINAACKIPFKSLGPRFLMFLNSYALLGWIYLIKMQEKLKYYKIYIVLVLIYIVVELI